MSHIDANVRQSDLNTPQSATPPKKPWWKRLLKFFGIILLVLVVLVVGLVHGVVTILTPERLTPLIERVASRELNAKVEIGRAELLFWKTFPKVKISVDNLHIISHSLDSLSHDIRRQLPADCDSLLSLDHFHGSINVLSAIKGEIDLNDVIIDGPMINLIQVNDTVSNFNIFPPSSPDSVKSAIPPVTINHFAILNSHRISFKAPFDSIDIGVQLHTISLDDKGLPLYRLTLDTDINTPMLREMAFDTVELNLDSSIRWDMNEPTTVALENLALRIGGIDVVMDAVVNLKDNLSLDAFETRINKLDVNYLLEHLPPAIRKKLIDLHTDMTVSLQGKLIEPLIFDDSLRIPAMQFSLEIPECYVDYNNIHFNHLSTSLRADIAGDSLNSTVLNIGHILVDGRALDLKVEGVLSDLFSDPVFEGNFNGAIEFDRLPYALTRLFNFTLKGKFAADLRLKMRGSDLNADNFHRLQADGTMTLNRFDFMSRDSITGIYTRLAQIEFGSNRSLRTQQGARVDSLLVVKLTVDTASMFTTDVKASLNDFKMGLGTTNTSRSSDTTAINPFGGSVNIGKLVYKSEPDSTLLTIRKTSGLAMLRRFRNNARVPLLNLELSSERIRANAPRFATVMRGSQFSINAHIRGAGSERRRMANDSLRRERRQNGRRHHHIVLTAQQLDSMGVEVMEFDVDNSFRSLLNRWKIDGSISSRSGRLRTSSFPIRQSYRNLQLDFTSDSIMLGNVDYRMGHSDFHAHGTIANIRQALRRERPEPLKLDLVVRCDTLNINELVQAHFAAHRFKHENLLAADSENQDWEERDLDYIENKLHYDSIGGPLLVPVNIDAGVDVRASNVLYSNLLLKDVTAEAILYRGTLTLNNIHAANDIGSMNLTALYSAPTAEHINFAFGMSLNNFHIGRLMSMIPALDTIVPLMKTMSGVIDARLATTVDVKPNMDLDLSTLRAALRFEGDNLSMADNPAMRTLSKWLMFKNRDSLVIDSVSVDAVIRDGVLQIYPFIVNIDRYKLGIMGYNNMMMDLNYHVAILKSPIPFKFGINIKGTAEKPKIRFGGAKFKESMVVRRDAVADTVRVNLLSEISRAFRRGVRAARLGPLKIPSDTVTTYMNSPEPVITASDSAMLINAGIIANPDTLIADPSQEAKLPLQP